MLQQRSAAREAIKHDATKPHMQHHRPPHGLLRRGTADSAWLPTKPTLAPEGSHARCPAMPRHTDNQTTLRRCRALTPAARRTRRLAAAPPAAATTMRGGCSARAAPRTYARRRTTRLQRGAATRPDATRRAKLDSPRRTRSQHGGNAQEAHSSSASSSAAVVIAEGSDVGHDM